MKVMRALVGVALASFLTLTALQLGGGDRICNLPCPEEAGSARSTCPGETGGDCPRPAAPQSVFPEGGDSLAADLGRFSGTWRAVEVTSASGEEKKRKVEEYLVLGVSGKERKLNMALLTVASSPARRVAHVETTLPIDRRLAGRFTFADDGWGNSGEGAVSLRDGRVIVEIRLRGKSGAEWRIFSGQRVFVRKP